MKLKNKLLLSTLLIGISTCSFANLEDCYKTGINGDYDGAIEKCKPYAKKDFLATVMIGSANVVQKNYNDGLSDLNWAIDYSKSNKLSEEEKYKSLSGAYATAGNIYYFGQAGKADKTKGLEYITKAANLGNDYAQYQLGEVYQSGENGTVTRDISTAYKWTETAIANGSQDAKDSFLNVNLDGFTKQVPYCIAMGEQLVAEAYMDGSAGLPKDNSKAKEYLNQAIALYQDNKPTAENTKYCPTGADKLNLESAKKELDSL
ncbi:tetratricopeptide repeat protein [Francisella marina]|uniref:Sel1 repeat family protein n=1 Tax=Francisella marina TaxID=2249302 RepID=A0ABX5ZFD8_9GAMM|nr:SEL1-like repeat protein [Francisella marina]QEO57000.1 sel1 repeat family protein [Francisella marina]QEO58883.1 sel1 repeat family protein [Francisella marina]